MLSGLMSRWMMPRLCAYTSARATSLRMLTASRTDSGPRESRARSDSPSTNGMMKNGNPSVSPALSTGTMCGCWSAADNMISRLNRSTETVAASSYGKTFTTTVRPSELSRATNTDDIPPPPSSRSMV
jgi:hypothetical protein